MVNSAEAIAPTQTISVTGVSSLDRPRALIAPKDKIRTSLQASTKDGVFASLFSNVTSGVLLTNFFLELGATPTEVGLLASIPLLANLMQPIGAYFSERTHSRHDFCLWVYGLSRPLWVGLAIAIFLIGKNHDAPTFLIALTLGVALISSLWGALGSAPWLSWMAAVVPRSLRGRYFGFRNSAANLTTLITIPLMGLFISKWRGGSVQGYGLMLSMGVLCGLLSLWFQGHMVDVDPQAQPEKKEWVSANEPTAPKTQFWQDGNFLKFLLYFNLWMFSVNLSAPFFNVYLLNDLALDISQVTLYNSLTAGANLLLLMVWGRLADRIGNRPILLGAGLVFGIVPLLWLVTGANSWSIWFTLPLVHLIMGASAAAIDLCSNNIQLAIAPMRNQSTYFGIAAAFAGISGAVGTMVGGFLAQFGYGELLGLFALSGVLRLGALVPLLFVRERQTA